MGEQLTPEDQDLLAHQIAARKIIQPNLTFTEIGRMYGITPKKAAEIYRQKIDQQIDHYSLAEKQIQQNARYERIIEINWDKVEEGSPQATDAVMRAMRRQAELWGLNAPKRLDIKQAIAQVNVNDTESKKAMLQRIKQRRAISAELGGIIDVTPEDEEVIQILEQDIQND